MKFLKNVIFDLAIVIFIILCYIKYSQKTNLQI